MKTKTCSKNPNAGSLPWFDEEPVFTEQCNKEEDQSIDRHDNHLLGSEIPLKGRQHLVILA